MRYFLFVFWIRFFSLGGLDVDETTSWRVLIKISFHSCSMDNSFRDRSAMLIASPRCWSNEREWKPGATLVPLHYRQWDVWKINHLLLSDPVTTIEGTAGRGVCEWGREERTRMNIKREREMKNDRQIRLLIQPLNRLAKPTIFDSQWWRRKVERRQFKTWSLSKRWNCSTFVTRRRKASSSNVIFNIYAMNCSLNPLNLKKCSIR